MGILSSLNCPSKRGVRIKERFDCTLQWSSPVLSLGSLWEKGPSLCTNTEKTQAYLCSS